MAVSDYDTDPNANVSISGINIGEGCSPGGINNALRQIMADVKADNDAIRAAAIPAANPAFTGIATVTGGNAYVDITDDNTPTADALSTAVRFYSSQGMVGVVGHWGSTDFLLRSEAKTVQIDADFDDDLNGAAVIRMRTGNATRMTVSSAGASVSGTFAVSGATTLGAATLGSATLSGAAVFNGSATLNGPVTSAGSATFSGATTFTSTTAFTGAVSGTGITAAVETVIKRPMAVGSLAFLRSAGTLVAYAHGQTATANLLEPSNAAGGGSANLGSFVQDASHVWQCLGYADTFSLTSNATLWQRIA